MVSVLFLQYDFLRVAHTQTHIIFFLHRKVVLAQNDGDRTCVNCRKSSLDAAQQTIRYFVFHHFAIFAELSLLVCDSTWLKCNQRYSLFESQLFDPPNEHTNVEVNTETVEKTDRENERKNRTENRRKNETFSGKFDPKIDFDMFIKFLYSVRITTAFVTNSPISLDIFRLNS